MRKQKFSRIMPLTALAFALALPALQPAYARPVKTPRVDWARDDAPDRPMTMLRHNDRRAAILMTIENGTPGQDVADKLIAAVADGRGYKLTREWTPETLKLKELQRGFSFILDDGKRGLFAIVWQPARNGKVVAAAYATTDLLVPATSQADFLMVRSFSNQLRRGAIPGQQAVTDGILSPRLALVPPLPTPANPSTPVIADTTDTANIVTDPAPSPALTQKPTSAEPSAAEPVIKSAKAPPLSQPKKLATAPSISPSTAVLPTSTLSEGAETSLILQAEGSPSPSALMTSPKISSYPFTAVPGATAGAKPSQISAIIYAPLEFSEVYVLFKDGSFHENLPVALEEWNIGASKKNDPDSWGKWSKTNAATDFELRYAADDKVVVTGSKVPPAAPGLILNGTYATETAKTGNIAVKINQQANTISFSGTQFSQSNADGQSKGQYRVDGYTIILMLDDGREARLPFFIIPPEEGETDELIWLGNEVRVKQDDGGEDEAPTAA